MGVGNSAIEAEAPQTEDDEASNNAQEDGADSMDAHEQEQKTQAEIDQMEAEGKKASAELEKKKAAETAKKKAFLEKVLNNLKKAAGVPVDTPVTIDDINEGKTEAGKKISKVLRDMGESMTTATDNMIASNGESGQLNTPETPKSTESAVAKYGWKMVYFLITLGAIAGTVYGFLKLLADGETGCYSVNTKTGQMTKMSCGWANHSANCNCGKDGTGAKMASECAVKPCNDIKYVWQVYTPGDVLGQIPGALGKLAHEAGKFGKGIFKYLIWGAVAIGSLVFVVIIGKVAWDYFKQKKKGNGGKKASFGRKRVRLKGRFRFGKGGKKSNVVTITLGSLIVAMTLGILIWFIIRSVKSRQRAKQKHKLIKS